MIKQTLFKNVTICALLKMLLRESKYKSSWKKIFIDHIAGKGLEAKIKRELLKFNS